MRGIAPSASVPKGLLRFALLLVAACLVGALVGIVTEPFTNGNGSSTALCPEPALKNAATDSGKDSGKNDSDPAAATTAPNPDAVALAALAGSKIDPDRIAADSASSQPAPDAASASRSRSAAALVDHLKPDLAGLATVGAILGVFALLAIVLATKSRQRRANNGVVHLVDSLPIGPGRSVHLLRCEGRKFLIGNSERGIHFLASVPQNEVERALDAVVADDITAPHEGEPTFESMLAGSVRR